MGKNKSFSFGIGLITGVIGGIFAGVLCAPKPGEESRKELKATALEFAEKHAPAVKEAKKQALESVDLMKYNLEKQYKKICNALKSRKMQKAKELEEVDTDYDFN